MYLGMQQCSTGLLQMLRSGGGKGLPSTEVERVPTINIAVMVMLNICANLEEAMTKELQSHFGGQVEIDDRPTGQSLRAATKLLIVCVPA